MASIPLSKMHLQTTRSPIPSASCRKFGACFISPTQQLLRHPQLFISRLPPQCRPFTDSLLVRCSVSSPTPPTSKEEAVLQAKISLSSTLEKPLNNPKLAGKLKKLKQPRLRVEIPVIDDSASSLTQLALDVFGNMPIRKKGSLIKILALWSDLNLAKAGTKAFESRSDNFVVESCVITSILNENTRVLNSADVVVFLAPAASELEVMKTISEAVYPKPVVIFNPMWNFDEESDFGELRAFVDSFEVVYSFMGLEVRGILSKRKGMIFKCVRDGILSGEKWNVFVEENNDLKLVSSFKVRPSIVEVETVLYNLMAINSPITKSAKFLKDLVSNATSKKRIELLVTRLERLIARSPGIVRISYVFETVDHMCRSVFNPCNHYLMLIPKSKSNSFIVISDHNGLRRHPGLDLPFETRSKTVHFVGSSNGLVCLTDYGFEFYGRDIYLINPFIRKYEKLDAKSSCYPDFIDIAQGIEVTFGYSEAEHDYNVCRILYDDWLTKIEVYSLKSGKWKGIESIDDLFAQIPAHDSPPIWVQGCLYWLSQDKEFFCFDLKEEVFSMITLPTTYFERCDRWRFYVMNKNGSVVLLSIDRESIEPSLRICLLVMRKDSGQVQWEEFYESREFVPGIDIGFRGSGSLMLQEYSYEESDRYHKVVAVSLDNPCARDDLELGSAESFQRLTGHADVLESLVLFSD